MSFIKSQIEMLKDEAVSKVTDTASFHWVGKDGFEPPKA